MPNRRPIVLLVSFVVVAIGGGALAGALDAHKGWNDLSQAVANISWITACLSALAFVVTVVMLIVHRIRGGEPAPR
jgi:hypothetical protein